MSLMEDYNKAEQAIFDHVGYVEDWAVIPLADSTMYFWQVDENENEWCKYAKSLEDFHSDGNYYEDEIYTQRHLQKYVLRGEFYTMVSVDTHTDGNKLLMIFENSKEVK